MQGFQSAPSDDFFVPYHPGLAEILYQIDYQVRSNIIRLDLRSALTSTSCTIANSAHA